MMIKNKPFVLPGTPQKEWTVQNHTFIGKVLVDREVDGGHRMARKEDAWIDYAVDLRVINEIKVAGFKEDAVDHTDLRHNGVFVATVNCSFFDMLPHFIASRHLFDNQQDDLPVMKIAGLPEQRFNLP